MTKEDVLELLPNGTMGYFSTVNAECPKEYSL